MLLPHEPRAAMLAHARFCLPAEACGLFAADAAGTVRFVYCLTNVDDSPHGFTIDPAEHFAAWRHARRHDWDLAGIFHSHVSSPAQPSPTDVRLAGDSRWVHVIVGPMTDPQVRAYRIVAGEVRALPLAP